jgi:GGDEF domain-containing protein
LDARTGLHTRAFLEATLDTEVHKAHRFGRRLACLCVEPRGLPSTQPEIVDLIVASLRRTLRTTDVLCSDERRFWVLVTETDSLGGVVLKRRLAERIRDAVRAEGHEVGLALGVASYPLDGESCEELIATALDRVNEEKTSVMHELGLEDEDSLASIGQRLLERAQRLPRQIVPEAAELLVSELTCRPRDRGLFFMAPGPDAAGVLGPLSALGDAETATELFIATDGDTVPSGASVTAVAMPPDVPADQTWMVRFGEAPAYALVAGPLAEDGTRAVFHSSDPVLVEHMTFRLRAEVGLGVHS